jgi:iron complex outermembrane receptor protein
VSDTFEGDRIDWRAVVDYRFSDQFLAYASASTGFKGGGVNPRPFFGPSAGECANLPPGVIAPCNQLGSFEPETLTTYEAGIKADLFDRRLRLNAAGFFNKYEDIILSLSACPGAPCIKPANVGAADVKGLEFEFQAYPVDGLSFDGSLALLDFEYTELAPGVAVTPDMITPYTPETTWSLGAQYDYVTDAGTFGVRLDGSYQSDIYGSAVNAESNFIESYFTADGRLQWLSADEDWSVAFNVKNIFDKYYVLTTFDQRFASGLVAVTPGLPRTFSVTVKRNFN